MGVKGDNLGINSGLLLPSFILNYMVIRVKEKRVGIRKKKNRENRREGRTSERRYNEEESKDLEE